MSPASHVRLAAVTVCLLVAAAYEPVAQSGEQRPRAAQARAGAPQRVPPDGWSASDVGRPGLDGMFIHAGSGLAVIGSGAGVDGVADQFHFLYQPVAGDVDLTVRFVTASGEPRMQAGAMIRASLEADAPHASLVATGEEIGFVRRATAGAETLTTTSSTQAAGSPLWMRLVRREQTVSLFTSADASAWLLAGSEEIDLPASSLVGLAVASGQAGAVAWGVFDEVSVRAGLGTTEAATGERQVMRAPGPARMPPAASIPGGQPVGTSGDTGGPPRAAVPRRPAVTGPAEDAPRVAVSRRGGTSDVEPPSPPSPPEDGGALTPQPVPPPAEAAPPQPEPPLEGPPPQPVPPPPSRRAVFTPSLDHHWNVDRYQFEVVQAGTSFVVATQDFGKPPIVNGECQVDISILLNGLPSGSYVGVLKAVNARGESPATQSVPFTR